MLCVTEGNRLIALAHIFLQPSPWDKAFIAASRLIASSHGFCDSACIAISSASLYSGKSSQTFLSFGGKTKKQGKGEVVQVSFCKHGQISLEFFLQFALGL